MVRKKSAGFNIRLKAGGNKRTGGRQNRPGGLRSAEKIVWPGGPMDGSWGVVLGRLGSKGETARKGESASVRGEPGLAPVACCGQGRCRGMMGGEAEPGNLLGGKRRHKQRGGGYRKKGL